MKIEKRVHKIWKEWQRIQKKGSKELREGLMKMHPRGWVDKWQYIYSHKGKKISMILLYDYSVEGEDVYEIYCLEGNLFDDVMRFGTKEEAEKKIKKLFGIKNENKKNN